jgi:F-type H+-transporting ATPase subunit delta
MKGTKAATRYAKALLELAVENKKSEAISNDMRAFSSAYNDTKDFQVFLDSPVINAEKKNEIFNKLFGNFDSLTISFIQLITKNGREGFLPAIAASFDLQLKAHLGIVPVTLISAGTLDAATKTAIVDKVQATVNGKLEIDEKIDTSLIGGFVIRMGDNRIDASISNQLNNLKQRLTR